MKKISELFSEVKVESNSEPKKLAEKFYADVSGGDHHEMHSRDGRWRNGRYIPAYWRSIIVRSLVNEIN